VNDSRWIKWLAIATAVLTVALVFLTIGEICFALRCANRLAGCFATIQSTFKADAGTVPVSNPYSYAYPKGNTGRYPDRDTVTNPSAYASVSST
jgi:hypothetical protein